MFPAVQAAPSFASSFPHIFGTDDKKNQQTMCLIPCAIDQDPYFRLTRDVAPKLGFPKPALLHSKFFPALQGHTSKMSASNSESCIMVTDSPKEVEKKVKRFAFSGGGATIEEHRAKGGESHSVHHHLLLISAPSEFLCHKSHFVAGDLEVDVPFQWLRFFEPSDAKLEDIAQKYRSGEMLTGEIKQILIDTLNPMLLQQQERRKAVSNDLVRQFMSVRPLQWNQIKPHPDYVPASAAEIETLKLEIEKQGSVVKSMKESKAAKEDVTSAVQVLNSLKDKVEIYYISLSLPLSFATCKL
jgi:tryptophanyl-tRNA synthetase